MAVEEHTKFSCTPSTSRHSSFNNSYGGNTSAAENNHSDDRQRHHLNKFPSVHSYSPALHATWKGGFIILDSETRAQFIGGFQAQPSCIVHHKAYEFSRKMPPSYRPICFLDCFFGLIPSERNVLIFKMLDFTFSLMITLPADL
ncbi:hypothetical protein ABKV19_016869 [Rosa sericea]